MDKLIIASQGIYACILLAITEVDGKTYATTFKEDYKRSIDIEKHIKDHSFNIRHFVLIHGVKKEVVDNNFLDTYIKKIIEDKKIKIDKILEADIKEDIPSYNGILIMLEAQKRHRDVSDKYLKSNTDYSKNILCSIIRYFKKLFNK